MSRKIKYIQLTEFDKVYSKCIVINLEELKKKETKRTKKRRKQKKGLTCMAQAKQAVCPRSGTRQSEFQIS